MNKVIYLDSSINPDRDFKPIREILDKAFLEFHARGGKGKGSKLSHKFNFPVIFMFLYHISANYYFNVYNCTSFLIAVQTTSSRSQHLWILRLPPHGDGDEFRHRKTSTQGSLSVNIYSSTYLHDFDLSSPLAIGLEGRK